MSHLNVCAMSDCEKAKKTIVSLIDNYLLQSGVSEMRKPGFSRKPAKTWRKPAKTTQFMLNTPLVFFNCLI